MWCPRCHTEVAAEIAQNGQSLLCTSCGTEIQRIYAPSLHPDTRSARELLERWSKADLSEVAAETSAAPTLSETLESPSPFLAAGTPVESPPTVVVPLAASLSIPSLPVGEAPISTPVVPVGAGAAELTSSEITSGRRDRPDRTKPERQTPKPRTTWRVDAAHTVTQPSAPLPPPVPPRRPHFSAVVGDEGTSAPTVTPPTAEAPPPVASRTSESRRTERSEPVRAAATDHFSTKNAEISSRDDRPEPEIARPSTPRTVAATNVVQRRLDPAHESLGGPHFDLQAFLAQDKQKPGKSESTWGQVLAYAGVGLITVGTTLVLWGWFGQVAHYAPTGWLICTVGQMLLFLGVTTLISGGMQQTSHEVTRRVEYLGDRILRFEHSADQLLRGPHFNENRERSKAKAAQTSQADSEEFDD